MKTAILFDAAKTTKPRDFGKGLHRALPTYRTERTEEDHAAAARLFAEDRAFDAAVDRMAAEAEAMGRLESGLDA